MATQQDTPNLPDIQTILAGLGTAGAGIIGVLKWLDSRKKDKEKDEKEEKTKREDWLIDNAFEIVSELRTELSRLRKELEEEKDRSTKKIAELEANLRSYNRHIRSLETLLVQHDIQIPERVREK